MSILIADSGSTKTEWVLLQNGEESVRYMTDGLNPYFSSEEDIIGVVRDQLIANMTDPLVDQVYFYGSGCGSEANRLIIKHALARIIHDCKIEVYSDLLAAAHACFGNSEGLACILGTGSNSGWYDGTKLTKQVPSLGFSLGDEGSGGQLGRMILNSYYYERMPEDLRQTLEEIANMDRDHILHQVYNESHANRFVASFVKKLSGQSDHPFMQRLIKECFEDFADRQLAYYGDLNGSGLGFVGSIASTYRDILQRVLEERELKLEVVLEDPMQALIAYHTR